MTIPLSTSNPYLIEKIIDDYSSTVEDPKTITSSVKVRDLRSEGDTNEKCLLDVKR